MKSWNTAVGSLELELTSAEPEAALAAINAAGIEIVCLKKQGDLSCTFTIKRKYYKQLQGLLERRGESLKILKKRGLFWILEDLKNRHVLLAGILLALLLVFFLPSRIFFIQVDGNAKIPANKIIEAAEKCGIKFGASRREVRSEKVKNALLAAIPELQWAGVNTMGCTANISVRERTENKIEIEKEYVSNIVADRDGYILSGTTVQGNQLFFTGQSVKAGQILISGYTDCGLCIQATRAEGEVLAQTSRSLKVLTPSEFVQRDKVTDVRKKISLLLRKKRINLWEDSGILNSSCGRMYKEYYITLPGGFQLPYAVCVDTYVTYETRSECIIQEDIQTQLESFAGDYLKEQMVAGQIQSMSQKISAHSGVYMLTGSYLCVEMIGREQNVQIGEVNGKSN